MHAEIRWDGNLWFVQDLGSRNGTFADGRRLAAGERTPLVAGVELVFGDPTNRYRFQSESPPTLMALSWTGNVCLSEGEFLGIPSLENCLVLIFRGDGDLWYLETPDEVRTVDNQESISVAGELWRVCLPVQPKQTQEAKVQTNHMMEDVGLEFRVSRNGEHIAVTVSSEGQTIELEPRAHASLLLALAQCRINDGRDKELPDSEHGWRYREEIMKMLSIDAQRLNLWVHRARRQFDAARIRGAAGIIERRISTQQMRIGTGKSKIDQA